MNEIILPYVNITYVDPIVYCEYNEGVELGFPEINELVLCMETLSDQKPYLVLLDLSVILNITNEGKRKLEKYKNIPLCGGTAIYVKENKYECVQNFIHNYQTKYPLRVFTSQQKAVDWLLAL